MIGLIPLLMSCFKWVFKPIATIAITMQNFPICVRVWQRDGERNPVVLIIEANKKPRMNQGNIFAKLKVLLLAFFLEV